MKHQIRAIINECSFSFVDPEIAALDRGFEPHGRLELIPLNGIDKVDFFAGVTGTGRPIVLNNLPNALCKKFCEMQKENLITQKSRVILTIEVVDHE